MLLTLIIIIGYLIGIPLSLHYNKIIKDPSIIFCNLFPFVGYITIIILSLSTSYSEEQYRKEVRKLLAFTDNSEAKAILKRKIAEAKAEYRESVRASKADAEKRKLLAKLGLTMEDLEKIKQS